MNRSIKKLNKGKAPGSDGLFSELFTFGGDHLQNVLHAFLCKIWEEESVPADWKNAIMIPIFKNKGLREDCEGCFCTKRGGEIHIIKSQPLVLPSILSNEFSCASNNMR